MAPIVARVGKYVRLDMGEKLQIIVMKNNPKESFWKVARIVADLVNKNINKVHACRIKKQEKENVERCGKFSTSNSTDISLSIVLNMYRYVYWAIIN